MATDAEIRAAGLKYIPQQKYLQNPYELPIAPVPPPVSEGITNTNAFTNSGGNDFNPAGNAFGYGSPVSEVNVRTFNPQSNDPDGSVANAQDVYNKASGYIKGGLDPNRSAVNKSFSYRGITDPTLSEMQTMADGVVMDNRQNYQANYKSPYEDSMELPYQGTLGNNEMYPSEKYPNSFMKGKLNRFRNTASDAMKFAGKLLPFPLNVATQFLPKGDDNGIGGGSYGIAGLSDDKKAAYNALAKNSMLFDGQQGFKTSTGKNFQAKDYVPNQLEIYNQMTEQGYKLDEDGNVIDPKTNKVIGKNKNYMKRKFLEASTMHQTNKIQEDKTSERNAAEAAAAAAGGNRGAQDRQRARDDATIAQANRDYSSGASYSGGQQKADASGSTYNDPFDPGGGEKDGGFIDGSNRRPFNSGGRAGYFFGGRVNYKVGGRVSFKNGGLAGLL